MDELVGIFADGLSKAGCGGAVLALVVFSLVAGCAGEHSDDHHDRSPMEEGDYRTVEQGVQLSDLNRGCSTSGTQGISEQLLGEMACLTDGALVPVSHPNISVTSNRVHLYLSPEGRTRLRNAANRASIQINSALRTIAEQYVLSRGCSVAATPGESNHETGRAIDVDNWRSVRDVLKSEGFSHPLPSSDPVHFEGPGDDLRRYSVLAFQKLWNANHPNDQIAEDGVTGPETLSRLAKAPNTGFQVGRVCRDEAGGGGENLGAELTVRVEGGRTIVESGGSAGIPDFFPGDTFEAYITLQNTSDVVWENPRLGYMVGEPHLEAVSYRIEDDHPELDQQSWNLNDANDHPENPAKSDLGKRGMLHMNNMSPGESKRVVLEMKAATYSFGLVHHPDVRGWLWHVDGIYGEQERYHDKPSEENEFGELVRDYVQNDVFDRNQWLFRGANEEDFEGWSVDGPHDEFQVNTNEHVLTVRGVEAESGLVSPKWTRISGDEFDELVVDVRSHGGAHPVALQFRGEGESFSSDRTVRFEVPGDGAIHRLVIPVGEHAEWAGTVRQIRIAPFAGTSVPDGSSNRFGLAGVYAQDAASQKTSGREEYASGRRVQLLDDGASSGRASSGSGGAGGSTDSGGGRSSDGPATESGGDHHSRIQTKSTCSTTGSSPVGAHWMLLGIVFLMVRRFGDDGVGTGNSER